MLCELVITDGLKKDKTCRLGGLMSSLFLL